MSQLEMNFAPVVPSISSSSMLVDLSISMWAGRKGDKRASEEVASANNAQKGVARVTKSLLGDCDELDALVKFGAHAHSVNRNSTSAISNRAAIWVHSNSGVMPLRKMARDRAI